MSFVGYLSICVRSRGGIADILAREGCRHNVASLPMIPLDPPPLPPVAPSPLGLAIRAAILASTGRPARLQLQSMLCQLRVAPTCNVPCVCQVVPSARNCTQRVGIAHHTQTERSAPARLPARYSAWPTFTTDAPCDPPTIHATQKGLHDGGQCRSAAPPPCNRVSL